MGWREAPVEAFLHLTSARIKPIKIGLFFAVQNS